jgi:hypothetical protein
MADMVAVAAVYVKVQSFTGRWIRWDVGDRLRRDARLGVKVRSEDVRIEGSLRIVSGAISGGGCAMKEA